MSAVHTSPDRLVVAVAVVAHLAIAVFPLSATGLVAPGWFIVVVAVGWLGGAVLLSRLARGARPRLTLLVPVVVVLLWFAALTAGEALLGWTA